jgi:hypothetical protein
MINNNSLILDVTLDNSELEDKFSLPIWLGNIILYSISCRWTGDATGNIRLEISNDYGSNASGHPITNESVVNWVELPDSQIALGGANGEQTWIVNSVSYPWARLFVENDDGGSGVSDIEARCELKGF